MTVQEGDNNLITRIRRSGGENLEIRQEFSKEGLIYVSWHLKLKLLSIFPRRGPCIKLHCGKKRYCRSVQRFQKSWCLEMDKCFRIYLDLDLYL